MSRKPLTKERDARYQTAKDLLIGLKRWKQQLDVTQKSSAPQRRKYREGIAEYKEEIKLGDDTASNQIYLGYALAIAGNRNEALAVLKELQITKKYVSPAELAILYTGHSISRTEREGTGLSRARTRFR